MSGVGLALSGLSIASKLSGAKAAVGKVPPKAWYAIAIIAALLAAYLWHGHEVKKHDAAVRLEQKSADDKAWQTALNAQVAALHRKDAELSSMSAQLRKANDEKNQRIADTGTQLLHDGPGKAACPGVPRAPAGAGGYQPTSGGGSSTAAPLPPDDGIAAVRWSWLVGVGEEADLNRQEALAWREWYQKLIAAWPKSSATAR